ncbi:hypothetical protein [Actinoplanes sp. NPDC051411]|uniref:hypothetical protein n=1 Tax=Actinoplanes sp. NPDC051411 TaxID=3155522 RepID=UPI00343B7C2F
MAACTRSSGPGRPHRPPSASAVPGCRQRIAWLLRVNRRFGPGGRDLRLAGFAARLAAAGCPASAGQLSRWETGRLPVPHHAVVAYEKVLGLPRNRLVTVVDGIYRHRTDRASPSRLDRRIGPDDRSALTRAEDLLDQVLSDGPMSGADWDELTVLLTTFGTVVMPGRWWGRLTQRLLSEQLVSDGDPWRQRSESTHRLLWLPASRPYLIGACAAVVRDPASQIVIEPLAVLDVVDDPAVSALIAAQLIDPVSERTLRGALLAGAARARNRQFSPGQLRRIGPAVLDLLTDTVWSAAVRPLAAELLGNLPPGLRAAGVARLRAAVAGHAESAVDGQPRRVTGRIVASVLSHTEAYDDGTPDDLLTRVADEMLFSANPDVRLHAAQVLGATPFRAALADACCTELRKPAVAGDPALAGALLDALPFVAGPEHRRTVETLVTASGLPAETAGSAAWTVAHVPGTSSDLFWAGALRRPVCRPGLTYALGISGRHDWLTRLADDPAMPGEVRSAARWWSNLPATVTRDARR